MCLCDSKEKKKKRRKSKSLSLVCVLFLFPPQLIPEAYPTSPLLYPFSSTSGDILGTNAVHGITEDGRLVSRILPDKCCWFARTRHAITRIPDSLMVRELIYKYHILNEIDTRISNSINLT